MTTFPTPYFSSEAVRRLHMLFSEMPIYGFFSKATNWSSRALIVDIAQTNPAFVAAPGHEFQNGDSITISGVLGTVEVNDNTYTVANATSEGFELSGIDATGYSTYQSGGVAEKDLDGVSTDISLTNASIFEHIGSTLGYSRIFTPSTCPVVRRYDWTSGTIYSPYNPHDASLQSRKFYARNSNDDVYVCLDNRSSSTSTVEPTGTSLDRFQTADGYVWKYLYTIDPADSQFLLDNWMPCRHLSIDDASTQWSVQQAAIPGTVNAIQMLDGGSGYVDHQNIQVEIVGDGSGATASVPSNGISDGAITRIVIETPGEGYTRAAVRIYSDTFGSGASARALLSPPNGNGASAFYQLMVSNLAVKISFDGDQSGAFMIDNDFRSFGLVSGLLNQDGTLATDSFIDNRITLDLTNIATPFSVGETVVGQISGATAYVTDLPTSSQVSLSDITGQFQEGESIASAAGGSATIDVLTLPAVDSRSARVIYLESIAPITRSAAQEENFFVIFEF
jgi:hypothetical protein